VKKVLVKMDPKKRVTSIINFKFLRGKTNRDQKLECLNKNKNK